MMTKPIPAGMSLLRTSALAAVSTAIKVSTSFISVKAVAWFAGPEGLAKLGQLTNIISIVTIVAGGGIFGGVTKYVAEYRASGRNLAPLVSTSVAVVLACSAGVALVLGAGSWFIASQVLGDRTFWYLVLLLGLLSGFIGGTNLLTSLLNGHKEIGLLTRMNVTTSLASMALTVSLVWALGVQGALLAVIVSPVASFIGATLLVRRTDWWPLVRQKPHFDLRELRALLRFTAMTVTAAVSGPVSMVVVRDYLAAHASWQEVGYWQGVWKVSEGYLMIATLSISTYFVPRLSELKNPVDVRREILQGYKILLPLVALTAIGIYLFRSPVIHLLFAPGFEPMKEYFKFQLIGDFCKIGAWVIAPLMSATVATRLFVVTEVLFSVFFIGTSMLFINQLGAVGVTHAFALTYLVYWIFMAVVFRRYLVRPKMAARSVKN
jgi:PST family polysaccharide transporter